MYFDWFKFQEFVDSVNDHTFWINQKLRWIMKANSIHTVTGAGTYKNLYNFIIKSMINDYKLFVKCR